MSSMQIEIYDALTGANIPSDKAKAVVESLQEHIEMQVSRANEAVLAKLDGMQAKTDGALSTLIAKMDAVVTGRIDPVDKAVALLVNEKQLRVQRVRWVIGTMIMTISAGYGLLHAMRLL